MIYISTPEKEIYRSRACSLVATTYEGELKVFANHAPLLAILRPGVLRIDCMPGCHCPEVKRDEMFVPGGFLEVQADVVTILADSVERSEEIDKHWAEQAVRQAREQLSTSPPEHLNKAMAELDVAIAKKLLNNLQRPILICKLSSYMNDQGNWNLSVKRHWSVYQELLSLKIMKPEEGKHFDPKLAQLFLHHFLEFVEIYNQLRDINCKETP